MIIILVGIGSQNKLTTQSGTSTVNHGESIWGSDMKRPRRELCMCAAVG